MNPDQSTTTVKRYLETHTNSCDVCLKALKEMEEYVAMTGDWPEGAHGLLEAKFIMMIRDAETLIVLDERLD